MAEHSKPVKPMARLADVLHELEDVIYRDLPDANDDPICEKCWGTGTQVTRDEVTKTTTGKPCYH